MSTIFVQIASYRDGELLPTLRDCVAKAAHPENLRFGICWQRDETETLGEFLNDRRFRVISVNYRDSKGVCWARNALQSLYDQETYTLQADSHHRFIARWDEVLIKMLRQLDSEKPLLTSYAPPYDSADEEKRDSAPLMIDFGGFARDCIVSTHPRLLRFSEMPRRPIPARFYCAHFAFAHGRFCEEVKHDPNLYFHGEELTIAVRAFTHGYDLFHPHRVVLWHEYVRSRGRKHWDDHVDACGAAKPWYLLDRTSQRRCRVLLGQDPGEVDFGEYGLGKIRTLDAYQRYAGIHFKLRLVQRGTLEGHPPPNPDQCGIDEWCRTKDYVTTILLDPKSLPRLADMDFWYVGVHDADGMELCRQDLDAVQIYELLGLKAPSLEIKYRASARAQSWTVWPHSRSRGWLKKITMPPTR
jgi:hypothetical protein